MKTTLDCRESFASRTATIRRDGPSLCTGLLEPSDNSYGWGKAENFSINYDAERMTLTIIDDGKNGFGSHEAMFRWLTLGKKNGSVTSKTVGKFGMGGYSSIICIANGFQLTTHFEGKKHTISSDIIKMCRENLWEPTGPLEETPSNGNIGTEIKVTLLPMFQNVLDQKTIERHFARAYHRIPMNININGEILEKGDPYGDDIKEEYIFNINWNGERQTFTYEKKVERNPDSESDSDSDSEEEQEEPTATLRCIILKRKVSAYPLLGKQPGLDVYRINRLSNSAGPIQVGDIGKNLTKGSGNTQGQKCHMILDYGPRELTDKINMDDCVGLTSYKEISEDKNKWNVDFLKILEEKAFFINNRYTKIVNDLMNGHNDVLTQDLEEIKNFDIELDDTKFLKSKRDKYIFFHKNGNYMLNEDTDEWVYPENKVPGSKNIRRGSKLRDLCEDIISSIDKKLNENKKFKKKQDEINILSEKHTVEKIHGGCLYDYIMIIEGERKKLSNHLLRRQKKISIEKIIDHCGKITKLPDVSNISEYEELKVSMEKLLEEIISELEKLAEEEETEEESEEEEEESDEEEEEEEDVDEVVEEVIEGGDEVEEVVESVVEKKNFKDILYETVEKYQNDPDKQKTILDFLETL